MRVMAYLCTKFEDSGFSRSRDIKEGARRKSRGILGWSRSVAIRYSAYDLLIAFRRNTASISYCFRIYYLFVDSRKFFLLYVHLASSLGKIDQNITKSFRK